MRWLAGGATAAIGLAVLVAGLPHLLSTGQVDPRDWALPCLTGLGALAFLLRWILGGWRRWVFVPAALSILLPPLLLALVASAGGWERWAVWRGSTLADKRKSVARPEIGILSGPVLYAPAGPTPGDGFSAGPLWRFLSESFTLSPVDALEGGVPVGLRILLIVQPRALSPVELVELDKWVRIGGRAVLLVDPDLHWADVRPLGHGLRAPRITLLQPLLVHWGVPLAPFRPGASGEDPVKRHMLDGGRMIQTAGASHFLPTHSGCSTSSGGLVAQCRIGRGNAVLVADADFANPSLWTTDGSRPGDVRAWTSDAPAFLADMLAMGAGDVAGKRVWLSKADGLPSALLPAMAIVLVLAAATAIGAGRKGEKPIDFPY